MGWGLGLGVMLGLLGIDRWEDVRSNIASEHFNVASPFLLVASFRSENGNYNNRPLKVISTSVLLVVSTRLDPAPQMDGGPNEAMSSTGRGGSPTLN